MAVAPKKKVGGLSPVAWGLAAVGGFGVFYLYRRMRASSAASAANQGLPVGSGATIPAGSTGGAGTGLPSFSSFSAWEQAALGSMTGFNYSASQALNDLIGWVSGQCVSAAGYTAIGNVIQTQGLPPGFGTSLPPLTVCAVASPVPPANPIPTPTHPGGVLPVDQMQGHGLLTSIPGWQSLGPWYGSAQNNGQLLDYTPPPDGGVGAGSGVPYVGNTPIGWTTPALPGQWWDGALGWVPFTRGVPPSGGSGSSAGGG